MDAVDALTTALAALAALAAARAAGWGPQAAPAPAPAAARRPLAEDLAILDRLVDEEAAAQIAFFLEPRAATNGTGFTNDAAMDEAASRAAESVCSSLGDDFLAGGVGSLLGGRKGVAEYCARRAWRTVAAHCLISNDRAVGRRRQEPSWPPPKPPWDQQ